MSSKDVESDSKYPTWPVFTKEEERYKDISSTFGNLAGNPTPKRCRESSRTPLTAHLPPQSPENPSSALYLSYYLEVPSEPLSSRFPMSPFRAPLFFRSLKESVQNPLFFFYQRKIILYAFILWRFLMCYFTCSMFTFKVFNVVLTRNIF